MIKPLDNTSTTIAKQIWEVWQASYAVEAALVKASYFPPLHRSVENFTTSKTHFFGFWEGSELAAVTEINEEEELVHVQSLVVHPFHFRKGIAQKLLDYIFINFESLIYTVETGAANGPAIALYEKNNFVEIKQWNTEDDIRKVRFERISVQS